MTGIYPIGVRVYYLFKKGKKFLFPAIREEIAHVNVIGIMDAIT